MEFNGRNIFKAIIVVVGVILLMHPSLIFAGIGEIIWLATVLFCANLMTHLVFHKSLKELFRDDD